MGQHLTEMVGCCTQFLRPPVFKKNDVAANLYAALYSLWRSGEAGLDSSLKDFEYGDFKGGKFMHVVMPKIDMFFQVIQGEKKRNLYAKLLQVEIGVGLSNSVISYAGFAGGGLLERMSECQSFFQGLNCNVVYQEQVLRVMAGDEYGEYDIESARENFDEVAKIRLNEWLEGAARNNESSDDVVVEKEFGSDNDVSAEADASDKTEHSKNAPMGE